MRNLDKLSTDQILNLRVKDLDLNFTGEQKMAIKVLYARLAEKKINWKPHIWAADEWFSPDGIPGIAIPFTLLHPKLIQIEKKYMGFCEGEKKREFFKLLCHETGHAIDNAFKLRLRKKRQQLFGLSSKKYPSSYKPNIYSTDYVHFLKDHYAQAHPDEDWAETFAVWLSSEYWKKSYLGTKAIDKLNYVDSVMNEIAHIYPVNSSQKTYLNYKNDPRTIEQYLVAKQKSFKKDKLNFYDGKLEPIFSTKLPNDKAENYLKKNKFKILLDLQAKTNEDLWSLTRSYEDLKDECKRQGYVLKYNPAATEIKVKKLLEANINAYKKSGSTRIYM